MVALVLLMLGAFAWSAWGLMSFRAVSIAGRLSRVEKLAGFGFLTTTYVLAFGMTQAFQSL